MLMSDGGELAAASARSGCLFVGFFFCGLWRESECFKEKFNGFVCDTLSLIVFKCKFENT